MQAADIFVGGVSIALGVAAVWVAAVNSDAAFRLATPKLIERIWGRNGIRILFALLGIVFIAVGAAIIAGFAPGWLSVPFLETP